MRDDWILDSLLERFPVNVLFWRVIGDAGIVLFQTPAIPPILFTSFAVTSPEQVQLMKEVPAPAFPAMPPTFQEPEISASVTVRFLILASAAYPKRPTVSLAPVTFRFETVCHPPSKVPWKLFSSDFPLKKIRIVSRKIKHHSRQIIFVFDFIFRFFKHLIFVQC